MPPLNAGAAKAAFAKGAWGDTMPPVPPTEDDRLWGLLSAFIWIIGVVAIFNKPKQQYVLFYAWQSIFMIIPIVILDVIVTILFTVLATILPGFVVWMIWSIFSLLMLGWVVVWVITMIKAHKGILFRLPVIGNMAYKKAYGMPAP